MFKLPRELLNDLRLRILGNEEILGKSKKNDPSQVTSLRSKDENLALAQEN